MNGTQTMANQKRGTKANSNVGLFIAGCALLYLFPISHLYYYNSEYSRIVPVSDIFEYVMILGSAILLMPYFFSIVLQKKSWSKGPLTPLSVIVLFGSMAGIIGYHMVPSSASIYLDPKFSKLNALTLIYYLICFVTGYYSKWLIESLTFRRLVMLFYVMMCVNALLYADLDRFRIYFPHDRDYSHNYQFFSDTFALFSLIWIAMQRRSALRFLTISSSLVIAFLFGSRGGFYALMITTIYIFLSDHRKDSTRGGVIGSFFLSFSRKIPTIIFMTASMLAIILFLINHSQKTGSRMARLISSPLSDKSLLERFQVLVVGLERLQETWLFGNYGSMYGDNYIHNFLSLWSEYGLVVFLCFLWLLIMSFTQYNTRARLRRDDSALDRVYRYLLVFNVLLAILVRSHDYPYIFINFGLLFAILHEANEYRGAGRTVVG